MRFLVNCYHPANYLILKNAMRRLEQEGHFVHWCIRRKDVICELMDYDGIKYDLLTEPRPGRWGKITELLAHNWGVFRLLLKHRINWAVGASISVAHAAWTLPWVRSVVLSDDDAKVIPEFVKLGYPFCDYYLTPDALPDNLGRKHLKHASYHTLAYLHPDHFKPDSKVLDELGLKPGEDFFVVRFVNLNAFHDKNAAGLNFAMKTDLIKKLEQHGRVIVSCEGKVPPEFESYRFKIHPAKMHSVLAFAKMLVSDSQTMTCEAATLGVPSVRCNSFVGELAVLEEMEHKYGLTKGVRPEQAHEVLNIIDQWLADKTLAAEFRRKRGLMLDDKLNLADWIVDFLKSRT